MKRIFLTSVSLALLIGCGEKFSMVTTTETDVWVAVAPEAHEVPVGTAENLQIDLEAEGQVIEGFGTAFSEMSFEALSWLSDEDRKAIYHELFAPGVGANFTINRTPLGANDFSLKYYSYNDVDGDLAMENFSIENDRSTLIPSIKAALAENPEMKVWASPWCPPAWMKTNKHYATRAMRSMRRAIDAAAPRPGGAPGQRARGPQGGQSMGQQAVNAMAEKDMTGVITDNGIKPEQMGREGMMMFTPSEEYYAAYALYFQKYIQAYREEGIDIYMVMPQNEPNSAQWYPSCVWTADGLRNFMRHLGPAMDELGVEVMHGTMERADWKQADTVLADPVAGPYVKGVAFQWAGSAALPEIHKKYPDLTMVMSEHQCHSGRNSWADFIHSWELLKFYIDNGVGIYDYWNMALRENGVSTWGWSQNSLICVNKHDRTYKYNYEYYLMKHASHYVMPGAVYLGTAGYEEALAFRNPDGGIVVLVAEKEGTDRNLTITVGKKNVTVNIPANSLSTIEI